MTEYGGFPRKTRTAGRLGHSRLRLLLAGALALTALGNQPLQTAAHAHTRMGAASTPGIQGPFSAAPVAPYRSGAFRDAPAATPADAGAGGGHPRLTGAPESVGAPADGALSPSAADLAAPGPLRSFEGMSADDNRAIFGGTGLPPDPTGEVGPNHYVQAVNDLVGVFSKTGAGAPGFPKRLTSLWSGTGTTCELHEQGDPIVVYDQLAGRWLISYFAFTFSGGHPVGPFYECIAISFTNDPTGAYSLYPFVYDNSVFLDYPKLSVWPDGYYLTVQEDTTPSTPDVTGMGTIVFDRAKMLAGQAAGRVRFQLGQTCRLLPSDVDGATLPPAGAPNYIVNVCNQAINVHRFHVDFATPANSTITGPASVSTAPYDFDLCGINLCVPQRATSVKLDPLGGGPMFRAAYRNFGDHQSIVLNHSVDVGGDHAGVRWYELRNPGGTPTIFQQGTHAPDADHRWMASIAMDRLGDIGLGYSVSGTSTYPGIRYTGRVTSDGLGTLRTETSLIEGGGSQTDSSGRWGDYSHLSVDPTDDCTFWYTNEYYPTTAGVGWHTRIGSFKFSECAPASTPLIQGFTWYSGGQTAIQGPAGTVITAFATSGSVNLDFLLVTALEGCSVDPLPVNPNTRQSNARGFIANTAGPVNRPQGTWEVCFRAVNGNRATLPVSFTVI